MSCGIGQQTLAAGDCGNKIKIFVSGLRVGEGEKELKKLFCDYGEVAEVVVDGTCATVTFQDEMGMAKHVEELTEILLGGRKLRVARVLEEQLKVPDYDVPFYQAGGLAAPMPNDSTQAPFLYQDMGLSSSYPSHQPAYPVWYPVTQYPTPSPYYDPAITDFGPIQPQMYPSAGPSASFTNFSVPPPIPNTTDMNSTAKSAFSFDTGTSKVAQTPTEPPNRPNVGCCHVCSAPSVQGVAPLPQHQQLSMPVQYHSQSYGHQLQPLTPITPSLHTGYMIPPTPTPTNLPPMTPTYFLPPSPAPYMMYRPHGPHNFQGGDTASSGHPSTSRPPPPSYTKIKPSDLGSAQDEIQTDQKQNIPVAYFTSPFKRFTKFRGTPTPARFPLRPAPSTQSYVGRGSLGRRGADGGDNSSWYQEGARWGQKKGAETDKDLVVKGVGEGPDLLRDCNMDDGMEKGSL